jgi:hypothetical protein
MDNLSRSDEPAVVALNKKPVRVHCGSHQAQEILCRVTHNTICSHAVLYKTEHLKDDSFDHRACVYHNGKRLPFLLISLSRPAPPLAANDAEAVVQAEAMRGSLAAELLDFDRLRIVKRLTPNKKCRLKPLNRPCQLVASAFTH